MARRSITDARDLALALGGRWLGRYGVAACPACQPERRRDQTALSLADGADGRLLAHCKKSDCSFRDILAAAGIAPGAAAIADPDEIARRAAAVRADADRRAEQAERLWAEAGPIAGTPAETYLRGRGITCALPPVLRFHGAAWHAPSARRLPAMLALVEGGAGFALHRTFVRPDGAGKAELPPGTPAKMMLGPTAGGTVRLADGPGRLVIAEGLETALSLACGLLDGPAMIWAALSTSGLRGLHLPPRPGRLTLAPDGDAPGMAAAQALAERAHADGWSVGIAAPPAGRDWNDVLRLDVETR